MAAVFEPFLSTETSCSGGPRENKSPVKMWKVPVLLLVWGSTSLWVLAEGASTVRPEDDMTTRMEGNTGNPGIEDDVVTTGASEEPHESGGLTTLVPASTESKPDIHIEDLPTAESTVRDKEDSQRSTTTPHAVASHSPEKADGDTQITVEKDGLATVTLIGIIVGVLLAIGIIGGIIIVAVRKMSGRYS